MQECSNTLRKNEENLETRAGSFLGSTGLNRQNTTVSDSEHVMGFFRRQDGINKRSSIRFSQNYNSKKNKMMQDENQK